MCCRLRWLKAVAMAGRPPASAMAVQLFGMRRHMLPSAETASVCMAALLGWRFMAWMMAMWPCDATIEPLHWSLPEIDARKKHACLATPASVMWLRGVVVTWWSRGGHVVVTRLLGDARVGHVVAQLGDRQRQRVHVGELRADLVGHGEP